MQSILIVDDDPDITLLLERFLKKHNYKVTIASKGEDALRMITKERPDLALIDFRLPDMDGMELLSLTKEHDPSIQVVIITGYSDVKVAINCIKAGAYDYITKPLHPEELLHLIESTEQKNQASGRNPAPATPRKRTRKKQQSKKFILGKSDASQHVAQLITLVAPTDMSVLINGETGTGKEVAARRIHQESKRAESPFVAVDCGALPKNLAGSELFGHKKGAFTGALNNKQGSFELANSGTLFLDEIGNLSYENQMKLLRVLQERKIKRIGENKSIEVDVRVIAATNESLEALVEKGTFREDLYHRLCEFKITLLPLRKRTEDIEQFAHFFLEQSANELNKPEVGNIDSEAQDVLNSYYWHGNLRELKNVIKRAVLLAEGDTVRTAELPQDISQPNLRSFSKPDAMRYDAFDLKTVVAKAERAAIIRALEKTSYNKSKTARLLKVDRKTLYNKMGSYGIDPTKPA